MSGIGFWELIILFLIGLIVLGPERLPRVANQIGSWLGQARRMTRVMKRQLEEELELNKPPTIKPPATSRAPSTQPVANTELPIPRDDDDYSPAHAADDVGTGVADVAGYAPDQPVTGAEPVAATGEPASQDAASATAEDEQLDSRPDKKKAS